MPLSRASASGPHADISSENEILFACARCGKSLGATEIKVSVFAALARIAAEGGT
jgi:hypothetical protein